MGLAVVWIAFAPAKLGGQAAYVMVNGISMEPGYHTGDLVIVRKAQAYQVGDVITYRDAEMGAFVIHRIVSIEHGQFVIKGDNNSWLDAYHPTQEEIVGKQWIHAPKLGRVMQWFRQPVNLSLTIVLLGGVFMSSLMIKPRRGQKGKNQPAGNFGGVLEGGLYLFGVLCLLFLGLGIFAFLRPLTRTADKIQYLQESRYSYSAIGTPMIYDSESVRSGEPVFPKLTCFLNIGFTYNVLGQQLQAVSGSHQSFARVMDEQSGWQRTIPMAQVATFSGNSFTTTSTLDLCTVLALVDTMEQETGLRANTYTLEIVSPVTMVANAEGNQIIDSIEPKLVFKFDQVHFVLATPNGQDDPLNLAKQGLADNSNLEANTWTLLGVKPTVGMVRMLSQLGLAFSLSGLLIISFSIFRTARQSPEAFIRFRYGALLVNVYELNLPVGSTLINVTTIDELAKLAERHNTLILHLRLNFLHCYLVQCNGIAYRYVFSTRKRSVAEIKLLPQEIVEYPTNVTYDDVVVAQPAGSELIGYVINKRRIAKVEVEETVMLRKLRL